MFKGLNILVFTEKFSTGESWLFRLMLSGYTVAMLM
jgi:hypothetical protein